MKRLFALALLFTLGCGGEDPEAAAERKAALEKLEARATKAEEALAEAKGAAQQAKGQAELLQRDRENLEAKLANEQFAAQQLRDQVRDLETKLASAGAAPTIQAPTPTAAPIKDPALSELVEKLSPAVLVVKTNLGTGAGFFVSADGLVVTNYHVVAGSTTVTVERCRKVGGQISRQSFPAHVTAVDAKNDLALVYVMNGTDTFIELAPDDGLKAGDSVFTIGNPGMGNQILDQSVTNGIISSLTREVEGHTFLQTNTAINPGNSGGPLMDMNGRVIGVVTAKAIHQENIGFAVPVRLVRALLDGREGAFKVPGSLAEFEKKNGIANSVPLMGGGIPVNTTIVGLIVDEPNDRIYALDYDQNGLLIASLSKRKVLKTVYTGADPIQLQMATNQKDVWVANRSSKTITRVDTDEGKVTETVKTTFQPVDFVMAKGSLWTFGQDGRLYWIPLSSKKEYKTNLPFSSIAYDSRRDKIFGTGDGTKLIEADQSKMTTIIKDMTNMKEGDIKEFTRIMEELLKQVKMYPIPSGNTAARPIGAPMIVETKGGRLYYNRCAFKLEKLDAVLGVLKQNPYSRSEDPRLRAFYQKYAQAIDQIHAASSDGKWVASGTHIYSGERFTVAAELPCPSISMDFSADGKTLWMYDGVNQAIVPVPVEEKK